jgi:hypothetical protein
MSHSISSNPINAQQQPSSIPQNVQKFISSSSLFVDVGRHLMRMRKKIKMKKGRNYLFFVRFSMCANNKQVYERLIEIESDEVWV